MERNVEFRANNDRYGGLVVPPPSGEGPGVLVIPAWFGFVPHSVDVVNRLARQGFVAMVPDLHAPAEQPAQPDAVAKLGDANVVAGMLLPAAELLLDQRVVTGDKIGLLSFGFGAAAGLWLASSDSVIDACVVFYGHVPAGQHQPAFTDTNAAFQAHFGRLDAWTTRAEADRLQWSLEDAGRSLERYDYPEGRYLFFDDSTPAYHEASAAIAWRRSIAFLGSQLGLAESNP